MKLTECGFTDEEIAKIKDICTLFKAQRVRVMNQVKIGDFPCTLPTLSQKPDVP